MWLLLTHCQQAAASFFFASRAFFHPLQIDRLNSIMSDGSSKERNSATSTVAQLIAVTLTFLLLLPSGKKISFPYIYRNQIALPLYRNNDLLKANKCWYTILLAKDWHYVEKFSSSQSLFKTFCLSSIKRHDFGKKANDYCTVVENHSQKSRCPY